jgi:2-dehydro-3-deoxygluconokinase
MNKISLMGECMIELLQSGGVINKQGFAGDVYNTAVYLKRLFPSISTQLLTAVGQDDISEKMVKTFEQEHIDTQYVFKLSDQQPGIYLVQTDDQGERSFLYWRENSAARQIVKSLPDDVINQLSKDDIFFFSGISLAVITPDDRAEFWCCVGKLKAAGVKIAFDLNYRPKLWASKSEAREQFCLAFEASEILLPGIDDFASIFDLDTMDSVIDFFSTYEYEELIIKNGEKNVVCLTKANKETIEVRPIENVVDTTSAGDSFNGAYLGARMSGKTIKASVELAADVAGFVIQHPGAIVPLQTFKDKFQ